MADDTRIIVVFYDSPCIDGAGAAWCFEKKYGYEANVNLELVPLSHGSPEARKACILDNVSPDDEVFFVDTSPKDEELTELMSPAETEGDEKKPRVKSITIWDHHVTEVERLEKFTPPQIAEFDPPTLEKEVDVTMPSAAIMVWKKLFDSDPAPELLEWIGKMEPPVALRTNKDFAIAAFIDSKGIKGRGELVATFNELSEMSSAEMVNEGNAILADQHNNTGKMCETFMFAHIELLPGRGKMWVPVVNSNVQYFGRRINEALITEGNQGTTVGVSGAWFQQGDGSVKLSLRTSGHPDAGEIAKHLGSEIGVGGGGHKTDAVVQFRGLQQFVENVPLYTKEQMHEAQWKPPVEEPSP